MIHYQDIQNRPAILRCLTGMAPQEFQDLLAQFQEADRARRAAATHTRRKGHPRRRVPGAGRKPKLEPCDRLLMTLVWLRIYPIYELLGFLFSLDRGNAARNVADVLAVLERLADFQCDRPDADPSRRPRRSLNEVMDAFPEIRVIVDTKEQRIRRPSGSYARQKPYYSMKKKTHTLKTQIAVAPNGRIESVGPSVPGGSRHDKTLLKQSGLLERLPPGQGAMADKAYERLRDEYPHVPLITPQPARRNHPLTEFQKMANRFISRYRIVVEHALAQMNRYTVLRQVYRGARQCHDRVVRVVAHLVNRRIAKVPLKTYSGAA